MSGAVATAPGLIAPHYEFDEDFQRKIIAMFLRDTEFAQRTHGLVKPEFFENAGMQALASVADSYFEAFRKAPGDKATLFKLLKDAHTSKRLSADLVREAASEWKAVVEADISDKDYVVQEVAKFAKHQALANAMLQGMDLLTTRDMDQIERLFRAASAVGTIVEGKTYSYGEMLMARTERRKDIAAGLIQPDGITTGYALLDDYLYHKGWGRKELSLIMGPAKGGKSMSMIDFGLNAAYAGHKVLYVTLEVASDIIADRMDANISDTAMSEMVKHPFAVRDKVVEWLDKAQTFEIFEAPSGELTPQMLRKEIERYKQQGTVFDLIVIDYADLMAPDRWTDNVQENSKSIFVALRGMAMTEGFAILTATQTNREGAKKVVSTMTDVAEDFNKIRIADIVISINTTDAERTANESRLYFAASRNGRTGFTVRIKQAMHKGKFITEIVGEE